MIKVTMYVDDPTIPESALDIARENLWSLLRKAQLKIISDQTDLICGRSFVSMGKEAREQLLQSYEQDANLIQDVLSTINLEVVDGATDERARAGLMMLTRSAERREKEKVRCEKNRLEREKDLLED